MLWKCLMEPVFRRSGFAPPQTPLTRRLLVYFPSGAYTRAYAEVVFRGTIIALRDTKTSSKIAGAVRDLKKVAVFRVTRVWKGDVGEAFEMPAVEETSMCIGFWPPFLKIGNDLVIYARRLQGQPEYYTDICTRTMPANDASKFKDFDKLGLGEEPKKSQTPKDSK
jgi:hypothetical protein